uniref:Secreted protein n=1 Tax=Anopheles triannulatus TaxID=58253 RepID=A0A2M4ATH4_9DIPT
MAATIELAHLLVRVVATVQYGWTHARAVAELLRLLENLRRQLARRSKDQPERVLLAPVHRPVRWRGRSTVLVHLVQNRHQEGSRLARARLGAGHQIAPGQDDRNGVLLHRRRFIVARQLDVVVNDLCQLDIVEGINVPRHVITRRLHGNIFVLAEIDTGVAVFEQLALQPLVALRELCVVHLAAAHSATIAATTSASSASIGSTGPAAPSRSATSTAVRSTIVESAVTTAAAATDVFSTGRCLLRISARFGPAIVANRRRWRTTSIWRSAAAVRRPVVASSAEATVIVIASSVATALEATVASSSVEAITTAAAVAIVTAATIVLIAASTTAAAASIEVSAPVVVVAAIVVTSVVAATAAITIRIATETASSAATAAAYSTAGTGVSR